MSKPVGKHLQEFLNSQMAAGMPLLAAATLPGALAAERLDNQEAFKADTKKSTAEWLRHLDPTKGFEKQEDMLEAMRDPLYKSSEAYRAAVKELIRYTPEQICGLNRPSNNIPTNADMIRQARIDVFNERRAELMSKAAQGGPGSAQARLELMEFHQDPANAEILAEYEKDYVSTHPLETEMRAMQARGERVGTPLSIEDKPADPAAGEAQATGEHASGFVVTPWNS